MTRKIERSQSDIDLAHLQDPYGRNYWPIFKGRDGSRTPMPWRRDAQHAGFSEAARAWLPVSQTHLPLTVDQQDYDPESAMTAWRALMRMRRDRAALRLGSLRLLESEPPLLAFERQHDRERLLCLFNHVELDCRFPMQQRSIPLMTGRCTGPPDAPEMVVPPKGYFIAALQPWSQ